MASFLVPDQDRHFNPLLDRVERDETQPKGYRRSPKQEKELAKRVGGHIVPMSGAGRRKGDVYKTNVVRIEAKTTSNKSFSITRAMVEKITIAARGMGETPCLVVEFLDVNGKPEMEIAILPVSYIEGMQ